MNKRNASILSLMFSLVLLVSCLTPTATTAALAQAGQDAWPRTYTDVLGRETTLEKEPERVALLFFHNYEHMLILGKAPYAATDMEDVYRGWGSLIPFNVQYEILELGATGEPNLEKILEVEPDLILIAAAQFEKVGADLEKIAPTIVVGRNEEGWVTWWEKLTEYGKILGLEEKAAKTIDEINGKITAARETLAAYSDKTVALITLREKNMSAYATDYVYNKETGLGVTKPAKYPELVTEEITLEGLAEMDPDYIFLYDNAVTTVDEDALAELEKNSVWASLKAFKNNNITFVDRAAFSGGPIGMMLGTETILNKIAGGQETAGGAEAEGAFPRTYKDGLGYDVVIEKKPERIAVLHFGYTEYLLAMDVMPVAAAQLEVAMGFETLKAFPLDTVEHIGQVMSPNLEKLVEIAPDLIIATPGVHDSMRDSLNKIAPVVFKTAYGTWEETLMDYAYILGTEGKAQAYIGETNRIVEETRAALSVFENETFVFLRPSSKGDFYLVGTQPFSQYYSKEEGFGLNAPAGFPEQADNVALEALAEMNPSYIFFQDDEEVCRAKVEELKDSSVWNTISAVQNGHIYYLDISVNTGSPLAVKLAAEQITKSLIP